MDISSSLLLLLLFLIEACSPLGSGGNVCTTHLGYETRPRQFRALLRYPFASAMWVVRMKNYSRMGHHSLYEGLAFSDRMSGRWQEGQNNRRLLGFIQLHVARII
jgi:hypothetical protein